MTTDEQLTRERRAEEQRTHYRSVASRRPQKQRPAKLGTLHRRNGDRASPDDDDPAPRLTTYVRFKDLVAANIVQNWPTLRRLIREQGFPPGKMLSPNTRVFSVVEVEAWLASRPTDNSNIRLLGSKNQKKATT